MRTDSNDDSNVENNHEVENAYDEMLSQIDNDMKVNTVSPRKTLKHVESLLDRTRSCKETDFHLNIRGMHSTGDNRKKLANLTAT